MSYEEEDLEKNYYRGVLTDVNTLPTGTKFYACLGAWDGKIVVHEGKRYVENIGGRFELSGEYVLSLFNVEPPVNDNRAYTEEDLAELTKLGKAFYTDLQWAFHNNLLSKSNAEELSVKILFAIDSIRDEFNKKESF